MVAKVAVMAAQLVVMAADSVSHRPLAPLPAPTLSMFHPYPPPGSNPSTNDWILNCRLWQWFTTVDTDRSGHISVVELR